MITITEYEDKYAGDFRRLNVGWLEEFGLAESHDYEVLDDPRGVVLDKGGHIYLAIFEDRVIGTAALLKEHGDDYELVKMSVDPEFQGKGISKLLIEKCLDKARAIGAKRIFLFSSSKLQKAIRLYTKYGFKHVPVTDSPFVTADVKMEFYF